MSEATPLLPHTPSWRVQGQPYFFFYFQPTGDRQNAEDMTGLMKVVKSPCKQSSSDGLELEKREGSVTKLSSTLANSVRYNKQMYC
jgi:hypothetical protein